MAPQTITVWVCQSCGHWTANSYFDQSNPDWRPRCKMKDGCKRPELVPFRYAPVEAVVEALRDCREQVSAPTETSSVYVEFGYDAAYFIERKFGRS